ncbi:DUF6088 family protein [Candidatus Symbiothrix dinenymphae]|uniref:DUF6088 family protein n=1 Tax=Candidatus Symbiothrix dinenymphae TaxID=467085 RepID=UPI0006C24178|nr:DUF6088 family protein [Candidatus Symbiothrix dinenymphae]GAP72940.1 hypothetical protein SAMD00024442_5_60 [Candidatus Symbiothrix dinenymphae]
MEYIENKIFRKVKRADRGRLFFLDSFAKFGNPKAVNKALERLVKQDKLYRVAVGIYVLPVVSKHIGNVFPTIDQIAVAIAERDKARIVPTGSYAMYKLGLTTQVPMNVVYYTDASARIINIGKGTIKFKKASAKNLSAIGEISKLAIQALRTIGKGNATAEEVEHIKKVLQNENPKHLQHDLLLAPVWIRMLLSTPKTIEK